MAQLAIDPVREHVKKQADAHHSRNTSEKQQQNIHTHGPIGVKRMKIDAAAVRRKNGRAEQMIGIYKHGRQHHKIGLFPIFPEKHIG